MPGNNDSVERRGSYSDAPPLGLNIAKVHLFRMSSAISGGK
jgi:hypothetical protein